MTAEKAESFGKFPRKVSMKAGVFPYLSRKVSEWKSESASFGKFWKACARSPAYRALRRCRSAR